MPPQYEETFVVRQPDCDPWNMLSPGGALRRAQEIAIAHCLDYGIDDSLYEKTHTIFLLSRLTMEMQRMPALYETVHIRTQSYGMHRALFHRFTTFTDANGLPLCQIDSRWVMVDTDSRRILRKVPPVIEEFFPKREIEHQLEIALPKVEVTQNLGSLKAVYSLCDRNAHINNSKYLDIVCDHLPLSRLEQEPMKKTTLFFRAEIPMGTNFDLSSCQINPNTYYFAATQQDVKNFEAVVEF